MRLLLASVLFCAAVSAYGQQADSTTIQRQPPTNGTQPVLPPGIDSPLSAPGTLMQSTPNPSAAAEPLNKNGQRKRTAPPSSPRSFGVSIPLGKPKRDTTRLN
jgi:hypothetical protein